VIRKGRIVSIQESANGRQFRVIILGFCCLGTRNGWNGEDGIPIRDLFKRRELIIFLASVVLFHLGNAAMLPMAGQVLAKKRPDADIIALSGCIIAAQMVIDRLLLRLT
jgi:hypothetical protein